MKGEEESDVWIQIRRLKDEKNIGCMDIKKNVLIYEMYTYSKYHSASLKHQDRPLCVTLHSRTSPSNFSHMTCLHTCSLSPDYWLYALWCFFLLILHTFRHVLWKAWDVDFIPFSNLINQQNSRRMNSYMTANELKWGVSNKLHAGCHRVFFNYMQY